MNTKITKEVGRFFIIITLICFALLANIKETTAKVIPSDLPAALPLPKEVTVYNGVDSASKPTVVVAANGDFTVVYSTLGNGVRGAMYYANGTPIAGKQHFLIAALGKRNAVAMNSSGAFVVIWSVESSGPTVRQVIAQRFTPAGNTTGGPILIYDNLGAFTSNLNNLNAAIRDNGDFIVVWREYSGGSGDKVYFQRVLNNGTLFGGPTFGVVGLQQVNDCPDANAKGNNDIAFVNDSTISETFVISWQSYRRDAHHLYSVADDKCDIFATTTKAYGAYFKRYNFATQWDPEIAGSETQASVPEVWMTHYQPGVTIDKNGNFVASWFQFSTSVFSANYYFRRFNNAGVELTASPVLINTGDICQGPICMSSVNDNTFFGKKKITMHPDGEFIATWHDPGTTATPVVNNFAQMFNANGEKDGEQFQVHTSPDGSNIRIYTSVGFDSSKNPIFVWRHSNAGKPAIMARIYQYIPFLDSF